MGQVAKSATRGEKRRERGERGRRTPERREIGTGNRVRPNRAEARGDGRTGGYRGSDDISGSGTEGKREAKAACTNRGEVYSSRGEHAERQRDESNGRALKVP